MGRNQQLKLDLVNARRSVTLADVGGSPVPGARADGFDPFPSRAALDRLLARAAQPGEVYRPWLVYAGASAPDRLLGEFHAKSETFEQDGLFHVALHAWGRRTAIRHAPAERTPFSVQGAGPNLDLLCGAQVIEPSCRVLEPEALALRNLAYWSDGVPRTRDVSITVNPIQSCPHRCTFCRRQYDQLDGALRRDPLTNLSPAAAAAHVVATHRVDWSSGIQVAIVTGAFATFDHVLGYTRDFVAELSRLTGGAFDPARRSNQNVHLLTHLARTVDEMRALQEIGVKTLQDTAEVVADERRAELMPKANPRNRRLLGKGELSFDDVLAAVEAGLEVFGQRHYFVTLILGLDTFDDTLRGLRALAGVGLRLLDRPVYQPFEARGFGLYAMSAEQLIEANLRAAWMFGRVTTTWDPARLRA